MSFVAVAVAGAAVVGAGAGIYASSKQASAAKSAAKTQANAADRATEVARETYLQTRADLEPYRDLGFGAVGPLRDAAFSYEPGPVPQFETGTPPPYAPPPFTGQFSVDLASDPGYQFRIQEGTRAIERSAASKGQLQSGNTLRDLTRFGQELASQEYGKAYDRAGQAFDRSLVTHQTNTAAGQQGYANTAGANETDYDRAVREYLLRYQQQQEGQQQRFSRLGSLVDIGRGAAGQQVGANTAFGQQAGSNVLQAGNAISAGQIGSANAQVQGAQNIAGAVNTGVSNYLTLRALGRA